MLGMKPATNSPIQSTTDKKICVQVEMKGENKKRKKLSFVILVKDSYLDCLLRLYFYLQVPPQPPN